MLHKIRQGCFLIQQIQLLPQIQFNHCHHHSLQLVQQNRPHQLYSKIFIKNSKVTNLNSFFRINNVLPDLLKDVREKLQEKIKMHQKRIIKFMFQMKAFYFDRLNSCLLNVTKFSILFLYLFLGLAFTIEIRVN